MSVELSVNCLRINAAANRLLSLSKPIAVCRSFLSNRLHSFGSILSCKSFGRELPFFPDIDWRLCSALLVMINLQHSGGSEYD